MLEGKGKSPDEWTMVPNPHGHCFAIAPMEIIMRLRAMQPFFEPQARLKTFALMTMRKIVLALKYPDSYRGVQLEEASTELLVSLGLDEYGVREGAAARAMGGQVYRDFLAQFVAAVDEDVGTGMFHWVQQDSEARWSSYDGSETEGLHPSFTPGTMWLHRPAVIFVDYWRPEGKYEVNNGGFDDEETGDVDLDAMDEWLKRPWGEYDLVGVVVSEYGGAHVGALVKAAGERWRYMNNHRQDPGTNRYLKRLVDYPGVPNQFLETALEDCTDFARKQQLMAMTKARTKPFEESASFGVYETSNPNYATLVPRLFEHLIPRMPPLLPQPPIPVLEPLEVWKRAYPGLMWRGRAHVRCSQGHDIVVQVQQNYLKRTAESKDAPSIPFEWDSKVVGRCTVKEGVPGWCKGRYSAGAPGSRVEIDRTRAPPPYLGVFYRNYVRVRPRRELRVEGVWYKLRGVLVGPDLGVETLEGLKREWRQGNRKRVVPESLLVAIYRRYTLAPGGRIQPNSDSEGDDGDPRGPSGERLPHALDLDEDEFEHEIWGR